MTAMFTVTVEPLGHEVECRADQPILDACLRAGVWLPHACTHGTCGTCKLEVLAGEVDHGDSSSFALMDFERDEGKALVCTATPRSDVVLEADVELEAGVTYHPVRDHTGMLAALDEVAPGIRRLVIDLDNRLSFNAGQYVLVEVPGAGVARSYSMANPPHEPERIELHVRHTPGGVATDRWIFSGLSVGDPIRLSGPYGRFFLREARSEPVIMVAGGTGLAPMTAMIRHVLERGLDHHLTLYRGARSRPDLYDDDRYRAWAVEHPERFTYRPCLSDEAWDGGGCGLVTDVLAGDFPSFRGHVAYVCGPPPMVDAALRTLMKGRLFPRDIYREDFFDAADKAGGGVRSPLMKR